MIKRYLINEIEDIWNQNNKISTWKKVESSVTKQLEDEGIVPKGLSAEILKVNISLEELEEREKVTNHDVASFVDILQNRIDENSEWVHYGLTSSDIVDTSNSLLIIESLDFLLIQIDKLINTLKNLAIKEKDTKIIGRTHGVFAEITFLGNIFSNWLLEINRNKQRIIKAKENIAVGKFSGAVGNYSILNEEIEERALSSLNLKPELFASQIVSRDRYAEVIVAIGMLGSCFDRISQNLRGYQRSEVGEIFESFSKEQKGSSAMPHKKNPITSERISGISRILRGYVITSLENISLWHERDISHSSVERNIGPDSTITLDFSLNRLKNILWNLNVFPKKMLKNLNISNGLIYSQRVMLELTKYGFTREKAYSLVQKHAQISWEKNIPFYDSLVKDSLINKKISNKDLKKMFDIEYHTKRIDLIFKRVFKK